MIRVDKGFRCVKRQDERWGFLEGQKPAEAATLAATFLMITMALSAIQAQRAASQ